MTVPECRYILLNGQKCRCAALRNQPFCLHHKYKSPVAGPPPLPKRDRYSRLSRWRRLGQCAPWLDPAEIPGEILGILHSLLGKDAEPISNLAAGRYLRSLLVRLGHVPFDSPGAGEEPPAELPADPAFMPAPALEGARRNSAQALPFPVPPRPRSASGPTAEDVHAALEEAFPHGRPKPGEEISAQSFEDLTRAFVRYGLVPPEMLDNDILTPGISAKRSRP